jgi:PAS domain S-box-containing protein
MLVRGILEKLWRRLIEPVPSLQDPEERHRARFVAILLVTLLPIGLAVAGVPEILFGNPVWRDYDFRVLVGGTILWSITYVLSRTGRHRLAAGLAVGIALVAIFLIVIIDQNPEDVVYLLMPLLLSSAVLPLPVTLCAVAAVVIEILLLPTFLVAVSSFDMILDSLSFVLIGAVLVLLAVRLHDDVGRERRAKLTESEERYRAVVEHSQNGILIVGEDYKFDYVNDTLCRILGRPREEIIGHDFREFLDEDSKMLVTDRYVRRQRGEEVPPRYEFSIVRKDGDRRRLEISSTTVKDSQGRIATIAQVLDITERKQAEEKLRESEERLRLIVDGTEALLINVSTRGRITYANEAIARRLRVRPGDMIGRLYLRFIHPEDRDRVSRAYEEQAEAGTSSTSLEFRVVTVDGDARWVNFVAHPIPREGQVVEVAGLALDITERRKAQEALRESEERYRTLVEQSQDGIYLLYDHKFEFINSSFEQLFGVTQEEVRAPDFDFMSLVAPESRALIQERERKLAAGEEICPRYEFTALDADGNKVYVEVSVSYVQYRDGLATQGMLHDITERKRTEEALRQHTAQLEALQDASLAITAQLDLDVLLQETVRQGCRLLEAPGGSLYIVDQTEGDLVLVVSHGHRRDHTGTRISPGEGIAGRALKSGHPISVDDYSRWEGRAAAWEDEQITAALSVPLKRGGQIIGTLGFEAIARPGSFGKRDVGVATLFANQAAIAIENARLYEQAQQEIAERMRAEEAVRESEEKYRELFESSSDGILLHNMEGVLVDANQKALDILGYTRAEIPSLHIRDLHPAEALDESKRAFDRLTREASVNYEVDFRKKSGETFPAEVSSSLFEIGGARVVQGVVRDIAERKEMEEQLRRQERLAAVGQLAGGIAHDFNNLLATIILYTDMVLETQDLSPRTEKALETILRESHRAADLVQQVLDFSRRAMMETEACSLVAVVRETLTLLRRTIPEHVRLVTEMTPLPCIVQADRTRIQQVLMNLALNARDAMPEGGELRIAVQRVTVAPGDEPLLPDMAPGAWACLTVSDTGLGMTEKVQEHLFEPFFTTKEEGKGTGLGLAQVYGIVKQHQGFIDADSALGEGTTFTIFLPLLEDRDEEDAAVTEAPPLRGHGETILVVEDAERLRRAVKAGLESFGYRVITAANGLAALEARSRHEVDLVLTDVVMPEMGGEALLRSLRTDDPHLKVIAMTGHVVETDVKGLRAAGFADAISKPFSIKDLARVVRNVLDE